MTKNSEFFKDKNYLTQQTIEQKLEQKKNWNRNQKTYISQFELKQDTKIGEMNQKKRKTEERARLKEKSFRKRKRKRKYTRGKHTQKLLIQ